MLPTVCWFVKALLRGLRTLLHSLQSGLFRKLDVCMLYQSTYYITKLNVQQSIQCMVILKSIIKNLYTTSDTQCAVWNQSVKAPHHLQKYFVIFFSTKILYLSLTDICGIYQIDNLYLDRLFHHRGGPYQSQAYIYTCLISYIVTYAVSVLSIYTRVYFSLFFFFLNSIQINVNPFLFRP